MGGSKQSKKSTALATATPSGASTRRAAAATPSPDPTATEPQSAVGKRRATRSMKTAPADETPAPAPPTTTTKTRLSTKVKKDTAPGTVRSTRSTQDLPPREYANSSRKRSKSSSDTLAMDKQKEKSTSSKKRKSDTGESTPSITPQTASALPIVPSEIQLPPPAPKAPAPAIPAPAPAPATTTTTAKSRKKANKKKAGNRKADSVALHPVTSDARPVLVDKTTSAVDAHTNRATSVHKTSTVGYVIPEEQYRAAVVHLKNHLQIGSSAMTDAASQQVQSLLNAFGVYPENAAPQLMHRPVAAMDPNISQTVNSLGIHNIHSPSAGSIPTMAANTPVNVEQKIVTPETNPTPTPMPAASGVPQIPGLTPEQQRKEQQLNEDTIRNSLKQLRSTGHPKPAAKVSAAHQSQTLDLSKERPIEEASLELSHEQRAVAEAVINSGKSVCISGAAGTGKSFLLKHLIQMLKQKFGPDCVAVTAPTGIAAIPLQGQTIHSFAGIGMGNGPLESVVGMALNRRVTVARWQSIDALVVDEVSMMSGDLFDKIECIARRARRSNAPFGGIQLVLCGDFFQLPPVHVNMKKFCFESTKWSECISATYELKEIQRQKGDEKFIEILNELRVGMMTNETINLLQEKSQSLDCTDGILPTRLYPLNKDVDDINMRELNALSTRAYKFRCTDTDGDDAVREHLNTHTQAPEELVLKVGAQVVLLKNFPQFGLINGSRGVVIGFQQLGPYVTNSYPRVLFAGGEECMFAPQEFASWLKDWGNITRHQLPYKLAWALSIHKSQGMTLDRVECDVSQAFDYGQVYVALSRCRSLEGLCVKGFRPHTVKVHEKVKAVFGVAIAAEQRKKRQLQKQQEWAAKRAREAAEPGVVMVQSGVSSSQLNVISCESESAELVGKEYFVTGFL